MHAYQCVGMVYAQLRLAHLQHLHFHLFRIIPSPTLIAGPPPLGELEDLTRKLKSSTLSSVKSTFPLSCHRATRVQAGIR
jgi:hypothetical protein